MIVVGGSVAVFATTTALGVAVSAHSAQAHGAQAHGAQAHGASLTASSESPAGSAQLPAGRMAPPPVLSGTVAAVRAGGFTVTEAGGTRINVNTGPSTRYTRTASSTVAAIRPGSYIRAKGTRAADGSLAATAIAVVPEPAAYPTPPMAAAAGPADDNPVMFGEVTANREGSLTVTTRHGSERVTTTASTVVTATTSAANAAVAVGDAVQVGHGRPSSPGAATVTADRVNIGTAPAVPGGRGGLGGPGHPGPVRPGHRPPGRPADGPARDPGEGAE